MPNHCMNSIDIYGPKEDLDIFWNGLKRFKGDDIGGISILRSFIPMPEELLDTEAFKNNNNWYQWALDNWGSKWGDYDCDLDYVDTISGYYSSAWGPCNEGILNVSKLFPTLTFKVKYHEAGMGFMGFQKCINGEEIEIWRRDMTQDELQELYDYDEE